MLLDDFKKSIKYTDNDNDEYFLNYYLNPAIERASQLSVNLKETEVKLATGTQSYDLTNENIASPAVASSGIVELVYDPNIHWPYNYKKDFYIQSNTFLFFPDKDLPSGTLRFKYNEYFTYPVLPEGDMSNYVETNLPKRLYRAVILHATANYRLDKITDQEEGIEEKQEADVRVRYGSTQSLKQALYDDIKRAEEMMGEGSTSTFSFESIQVI